MPYLGFPKYRYEKHMVIFEINAFEFSKMQYMFHVKLKVCILKVYVSKFQSNFCINFNPNSIDFFHLQARGVTLRVDHQNSPLISKAYLYFMNFWYTY